MEQLTKKACFKMNSNIGRKRHIEEVDSLEKLQKPVANANLHGAVTSLSSVKKGRNSSYIDGTISDGHCRIRLVGFLPAQQNKS